MGRNPTDSRQNRQSSAPATNRKCYLRLAIVAQGVAFEVGLNDLPLAASGETADCQTDFGVNEFATGQDVLWARVIGQGHLSAELYLADPEKPEPTPLQVLAKLDYPGDADRFEQEPSGIDNYPRHLGRLPVDYGDPRLPIRVAPFWGQAERLGPDLQPGQRQQVLGLMESIRGMVLAKNATALTNAMAYRTRDVASANYHDPARKAQIVREEIDGVFQGSGTVSALDLDPEGIEWVVGANERIVLARQALAFAMPLSFEVDDVEFGLECYFGRVKGEWLLVR